MPFLAFFGSGQGILLLGAIAGLAVLLWDWRVSLGVLLVLQIGIASLATTVGKAPAQIVLVQTLIVALCCAMLATSALQIRMERGGRQAGGWLFRLLVLGLLAAALWSLELNIALPDVPQAVARLFVWLGLIALVMLSLGDNAIFTAVALLLWCVLGQAVAVLYLPVPEVLVLVGIVLLAVSFTCSYLIVAERLPRASRKEIPSDNTFPVDERYSNNGGQPGVLRPPSGQEQQAARTLPAGENR